MAILAVLSGITMLWMMDMFHHARDTAALTDAKNLITVVNNNFLDNESVLYDAIRDNQLGVMEEDGTTPRKAAYGLSPGVEIKFISSPNLSSRQATVNGIFQAWLYHDLGTPDPLDFSGAGVGRKVIQLIIDEASGVQEYIVW
jgi:hypothetical protein